MALLIFFSSSGLSIDIHYCKGKVKRLNLLGKAKSCSEVDQELSHCYNSENENSSCSVNGTHDGCCNNQSFKLDLDFDSGEILATNFTDIQDKLVIAYVLSYLKYSVPSTTLDNYRDYHPPPLERDIAVLFQVFRL